jgi:hypothetical protein
MKGGEILDQVDDDQILKKDALPYSCYRWLKIM